MEPIVIEHHAPESDAFLFLDRDGVIVENRDDYILATDNVEMLPGAVEAVRTAQAAGLAIAVVTNQSPIGRGLISAEKLIAVHLAIIDRLDAGGVRVATTAICPHASDAGCPCRKPRAGLLAAIAHAHPVDRARSWMIGDAISDMDCARTFGVAPILVETGRGRRQLADHGEPPFFPVARDVAAAVDHIAGATRVSFDPGHRGTLTAPAEHEEL